MAKIVESVGAASGTLKGDKSLSKKIELAMSKAVEKAQKEGLTDSHAIRTRMLEAREKVLKESS
jgi:hypothetical protein